MISAFNACEISRAYSRFSVEHNKTMNIVNEKIYEAAKASKYEVTIDIELSEDQIYQIKEKGYGVIRIPNKRVGDKYIMAYKICWW